MNLPMAATQDQENVKTVIYIMLLCILVVITHSVMFTVLVTDFIP